MKLRIEPLADFIKDARGCAMLEIDYWWPDTAGWAWAVARRASSCALKFRVDLSTAWS